MLQLLKMANSNRYRLVSFELAAASFFVQRTFYYPVEKCEATMDNKIVTETLIPTYNFQIVQVQAIRQ